MASESLSQEILFGTLEDVKKLVQKGANLNEKDRWGLTPLIQATIINNLSIATFLLEQGADVDLKDVTGQTALQWAVNRRNFALSELYLKYQANPNHYSADGQPILVNPILRGEDNIIQLLVNYGANLTFPEDYINAKLIGHRFELIGKADIVNTKGQFIELNFEGFYLEFTVDLIQKTLINFCNSPTGKTYKVYETILQKIIRTFKTASELIHYKYVMEGPKEHQRHTRELLSKDLVMIPVAYEGHAITYVKYKNLLAKCDRGVKRIVDTVVAYQVGNPVALNPDFMNDLMYTPKSKEYINTEVKKILNLNFFATLPARYQQSGNCSWANVEASVPAMMFLLLFRGETNNRTETANLKNSIMNFYDTWVEWDKDRVLDECIKNFHSTDHVRKASIAAILGAILLQRCRPWIPREVTRAKKILPILTIPEYHYILKGYIKVYCTKSAGKLGEDFIKLLKMLGLNFSTLTLTK